MKYGQKFIILLSIITVTLKLTVRTTKYAHCTEKMVKPTILSKTFLDSPLIFLHHLL